MNPLPEPRADWALFLDVDGTLIELADHPDAVRPSCDLSRILHRIAAAQNAAVAFVSGRSIRLIDRLTGRPALAAAGLHGLEIRLPDGTCRQTAPDTAALAAARDAIEALVAAVPGARLEDKGLALAVHYRDAPQAYDAIHATVDRVCKRFCDRLEPLQGKSVLELKPAGSDKGRAIDTLMAYPPFTDRRPVYIGDDLTDEPAFATVNAMGGLSIRVGDNATSAADYTLKNVEEVLAWLQRIAATTSAAPNEPT